MISFQIARIDYDGNYMLDWYLLFLGRKVEVTDCFERALLIKLDGTSSNERINRVAKSGLNGKLSIYLALFT
ncbi:hypothetical protein SRABI27_01554 [Pedobacter sp. Bi27]|uniref:hypothetical protein n=1 Tax=unclassified Pedobacter TaxID=2628915 RepID=UPI001DD82A8D|nr:MULTISPECIES: hypothetical protein [unclassified Pedobacter]CAH0169108.1 hypothetical protein SRABI36_01215 [Pedobacter sp. Bi36]CAH0193093.1 hypothetical protein SRABI27_01554 [Pedobacter sp. Bi27]CAH0224924.1 hypothetical protein SRABI126_02307 [Pedobacter sp. Bi126]